MKISRKLKAIPVLLTAALALSALPSRGAYFPEPVVTDPAAYDLLWGYIGPSFIAGGELAAFDQGGTIRLRGFTVDEGYPLTAFYGPPTGSTSPFDMVWQLFDSSKMILYSATVAPGTPWTYQGNQAVYRVDLNLGEVLMVVPEPSTLLALALVAASGAGIFKFRKRRDQ